MTIRAVENTILTLLVLAFVSAIIGLFFAGISLVLFLNLGVPGVWMPVALWMFGCSAGIFALAGLIAIVFVTTSRKKYLDE